jgi:hypothetical protein
MAGLPCQIRGRLCGSPLPGRRDSLAHDSFRSDCVCRNASSGRCAESIPRIGAPPLRSSKPRQPQRPRSTPRRARRKENARNPIRQTSRETAARRPREARPPRNDRDQHSNMAAKLQRVAAQRRPEPVGGPTCSSTPSPVARLSATIPRRSAIGRRRRKISATPISRCPITLERASFEPLCGCSTFAARPMQIYLC